MTKPHVPETSLCLAELPWAQGRNSEQLPVPMAWSTAAPHHSSGQPLSRPPASCCPVTAASTAGLSPPAPVQPLQWVSRAGPSAGSAAGPSAHGSHPALTVTGSCLSEELRDSLMEQWMTLSETIWISHEIRPIFTWYSLLSKPRLSGSF